MDRLAVREGARSAPGGPWTEGPRLRRCPEHHVKGTVQRGDSKESHAACFAQALPRLSTAVPQPEAPRGASDRACQSLQGRQTSCLRRTAAKALSLCFQLLRQKLPALTRCRWADLPSPRLWRPLQAPSPRPGTHHPTTLR